MPDSGLRVFRALAGTGHLIVYGRRPPRWCLMLCEEERWLYERRIEKSGMQYC